VRSSIVCLGVRKERPRKENHVQQDTITGSQRKGGTIGSRFDCTKKGATKEDALFYRRLGRILLARGVALFLVEAVAEDQQREQCGCYFSLGDVCLEGRDALGKRISGSILQQNSG